MDQTKVLLIDDKEVYREGLARLLLERRDIVAVHQCSNGKQALDDFRKLKPRLVLVSDSISGTDCVDLVKAIRNFSPEAKVAVISGSQDQELMFSSIESGATGYLHKSMKLDELLRSVELVAAGEIVVSESAAKKLVDKFSELRAADTGIPGGLTEREIEILRHLAAGLTNKEIADALCITENTAKVHVKNIIGKLGLRNRQQAAAYAVQHGLLPESPNPEAP